jgi:hypothetical protein
MQNCQQCTGGCQDGASALLAGCIRLTLFYSIGITEQRIFNQFSDGRFASGQAMIVVSQHISNHIAAGNQVTMATAGNNTIT